MTSSSSAELAARISRGAFAGLMLVNSFSSLVQVEEEKEEEEEPEEEEEAEEEPKKKKKFHKNTKKIFRYIF